MFCADITCGHRAQGGVGHSLKKRDTSSAGVWSHAASENSSSLGYPFLLMALPDSRHSSGDVPENHTGAQGKTVQRHHDNRKVCVGWCEEDMGARK